MCAERERKIERESVCVLRERPCVRVCAERERGIERRECAERECAERGGERKRERERVLSVCGVCLDRSATRGARRAAPWGAQMALAPRPSTTTRGDFQNPKPGKKSL